MLLGSVIIIGGLIYMINPNAFRGLNERWTSATRNSMLPQQYARRTRLIAGATILLGILMILKDLFLKK